MELCVVPIGSEVSLSDYVAACQRVLLEAGLSPELHAFGTNVEGDIDELLAVVKRCHERLHDMGAARLQTSIKLATRSDRQQTLQDKVNSVKHKLDQ